MQPVLWTKGLLLTPQHLQTQDRFLEDLLEFRLAAHAFCPWGFHRLEIDHEALDGGTFAVSHASGAFPDGLLFDMPESDPPPAPKPLDDYWEPDREAMDLFLAVPEQRLGGYNVSPGREGGSTRFFAEAVFRRDENTGAKEMPVEVARKNVRILTEIDALDGNTVLPVARVKRAQTGEYRLAARFVPPVLSIEASPYLMAIARRLVELLSARSATLSGMRRERRKGQAHFGVSDVVNFWLLYAVNSFLPIVDHFFERERGHPGELYEMMLSLAGTLTTFSTSVRPADLPGYDHGNLSSCFSELDDTVRELLDTVVPSNHVMLPLRPTEPSIHATAIEQERYLEAREWYLGVRADMDLPRLLEKVPQLVKVSSRDRMDMLIKRALDGLELRHVPDPPSALPVKLDYQYFRLERTGSDWDAIRSALNLVAYVPDDFPDPKLELLILLPPDE